jgi:hypothetical protein
MSTMHKQTITFTKPQTAFIQMQAKRLGISFADTVRRIIDAYRAGKEAK